MRRGVKKLLVFGTAVALSVASAMTSFATISYSEWYHNQFGDYPDGNITDWEQDPVYWEYLSENDPQAYKKLQENSQESGSTAEANPYDLKWSSTTAKWSVDGQASKYQVTLYRDDRKVAAYTITGKSKNFSSDITRAGDYWFTVKAYSKYGKFWSSVEESDVKYFEKSSSDSSGNSKNSNNNSPSNSGNNSKGPGETDSWSNRWVGSAESWQVKNTNGNGYLTNCWWMDGSTNDWYLIGCTGAVGRESYMSAGLFRDARGDWYLLNPLHDGTYGKMLSGDANGNYTLNYNGQSIPVTFNKNHDGTYGKITSDVNSLLNVLGNHFELNYVPVTAQ